MTLTRQTKLEIKPLCDRAFIDIKNKVSRENVVNEFFSWVTARWIPSHSLIVG